MSASDRVELQASFAPITPASDDSIRGHEAENFKIVSKLCGIPNLTVARVKARAGQLRVKSILAHQFADVPRTARPDRITLLEEDKIQAYYTGGYLYATAERREPLPHGIKVFPSRTRPRSIRGVQEH